MTVTFDPGGSLAHTYRGQRSDRGFTAGFLGLSPEDERLRDSLLLAAEAGMEVRFEIAPLDNPEHPNDVAFHLEDGDREMTLRGASVGGGMFRVTEVDGVRVDFTGETYVLAAWGGGTGLLRERLRAAGHVPLSEYREDRIYMAELVEAPAAEILHLPSVERVVVVPPVLPVPARPGVGPLFRSGGELAKLCQAEGITLGEAGLRYEMWRSGWNETATVSRMHEILVLMERSVDRGLTGEFRREGALVEPSAGGVEAARAAGRLLGGTPLSAAVAGAVAVMEYSNAMGVVVAAPTAGSCGVIPGVLRGVAISGGVDRGRIIRGLFAAGAVGLIVAMRGTFAAEVGGCQVECGVSSAMAAAALVEIAGGEADLALEAAAVALQNTLGLICDPVACLVEVPCITRNAMAVGNALAVADLVLGGYRQYIPFDEVVDAMMEVARAMPSAHRCTGMGGIAATPTARCLACEGR